MRRSSSFAVAVLIAATPASAPLAPPSAVAMPGQHAATKGDNPEARRTIDALNRLESQGYADFSDFGATGGNFSAMAAQDGRRVRVIVNPDTGEIRAQ
ncbi:MAG: PepSY domain-containing protein [Alphaproteobacteria bacterium]|nr:PepSY domain-containing protein [Alphaproteobacteria bacterium]